MSLHIPRLIIFGDNCPGELVNNCDQALSIDANEMDLVLREDKFYYLDAIFVLINDIVRDYFVLNLVQELGVVGEHVDWVKFDDFPLHYAKAAIFPFHKVTHPTLSILVARVFQVPLADASVHHLIMIILEADNLPVLVHPIEHIGLIDRATGLNLIFKLKLPYFLIVFPPLSVKDEAVTDQSILMKEYSLYLLTFDV